MIKVVQYNGENIISRSFYAKSFFLFSTPSAIKFGQFSTWKQRIEAERCQGSK